MPETEKGPLSRRPIMRFFFGSVDSTWGWNKKIPYLAGIPKKIFGVDAGKIHDFMRNPTLVVQGAGSNLVSKLLNTVADHAASLEPASNFGKLRNLHNMEHAASRGDLAGMNRIFDIYAGDKTQSDSLANIALKGAFYGHSEQAADLALPRAQEWARNKLFIDTAIRGRTNQLTSIAQHGVSQNAMDYALNRMGYSEFMETGTPTELMRLGANPFVKSPSSTMVGGTVGSRTSFFERCAQEAQKGSVEHIKLLGEIKTLYPQQTAQQLAVMPRMDARISRPPI